MVLQDHVTKNLYISTTTLYMATKLARMVIYLDRLLIIKSYKALITCSCKVNISIAKVPMANKLGKMMTSLDGLLPIISHDPLITWPCEIRGSLTGSGSAHKCFSRHLLFVFIWKDKFPVYNLVFLQKRSHETTITDKYIAMNKKISSKFKGTVPHWGIKSKCFKFSVDSTF